MDHQFYLGIDVGKIEHHATAISAEGTVVHDKTLTQSEPKTVPCWKPSRPSTGLFWWLWTSRRPLVPWSSPWRRTSGSMWPTPPRALCVIHPHPETPGARSESPARLTLRRAPAAPDSGPDRPQGPRGHPQAGTATSSTRRGYHRERPPGRGSRVLPHPATEPTYQRTASAGTPPVEYPTAGWVDSCNNRRFHGSLGMLTPTEFEALHCQALDREPEPAK